MINSTKYIVASSFIGLAMSLYSVIPAAAKNMVHIPMNVKSGKVTDVINGRDGEIHGRFAPEEVAGAIGRAVMFDGYSSYIDVPFQNLFPGNSPDMTFSLWMAVPCYPIVEIDVNTQKRATIVSCLDSEAKKGFGLYLGIDGRVEFSMYNGGWLNSVVSNKAINPYEWNNVAAVLDSSSRMLTLYINGESVGSTRCNGVAEQMDGVLRFGHGPEDKKSGLFNLMAFNGIIDEVTISDEAINPETLKKLKAENACDLSIPASRFEHQAQRPRFHGMPGAAWTNESHGLTKAPDGRYHVFFQKNANGPYMARLHWGHISSPNLFDWREEKIAFAPGESYDFKGCWSGCVFTDDELTGGLPAAIYTGVDYGKASIDFASPDDNSLINWTKSTQNPLISGRPQGLSDDFRDPYFFRNGDKAYIIVGTSKDNKGAATLHRYENGRWTNDGSIFFSSSNASMSGRFWEMPNLTRMANGKWLFTATPLDMTGGVRTLYWTGDINADGTFAPDTNSAWPRQVELISKDGYGLLSPTIYQENGKTIALGIVPDKLPGSINYDLGWAHCYSLPREWSIDSKGNLSQRPYEGLKEMRSDVKISKDNFTLTGSQSMNPVEGYQAELLMTAEAGNSEIGFNIFKGSTGEGKVSIDCSTSRLKVDFTSLSRYHNDDHSYAGIYSCNLPEQLKKGEDVTLNVFIDGSVLDIFVNNRWATSIRVFPTGDDATGIEAFATAPANIKSLQGWTLASANPTGVGMIESGSGEEQNDIAALCSLDGQIILNNADQDGVRQLLPSLPAGIYLHGSRKFIVR
ncbi:MAG: GH32 C-terminal domain-containing protein [Muribaculaceae bacterium]|nr:GH32 C-terminal domain-containing protein [Muribaculaceae bacterium]